MTLRPKVSDDGRDGPGSRHGRASGRRGAAGSIGGTRRPDGGHRAPVGRAGRRRVPGIVRRVHPHPPRHRCTGQRGGVRHLLRHVAHRCGGRQRRRHLLAVQRLLRRLRRQRPADGYRKSVGAERCDGLGAVGGGPVHPQRCAVGGAAADRCRHRRLLQRRPHRAAGVDPAATSGHAVVSRRRRHAAAPAGPADRRRRRTPGRRTRLRRRAHPAVGIQRRQRSSGHLSELHRLGGRNVLRWRPIRLRQPRVRRGVRLPRAADQRRPRRPARIGHQRQRRLLPQPVPAGQDGAVPVRHLQPGGDRRGQPASGGVSSRCPSDRSAG